MLCFVIHVCHIQILGNSPGFRTHARRFLKPLADPQMKEKLEQPCVLDPNAKTILNMLLCGQLLIYASKLHLGIVLSCFTIRTIYIFVCQPTYCILILIYLHTSLLPRSMCFAAQANASTATAQMIVALAAMTTRRTSTDDFRGCAHCFECQHSQMNHCMSLSLC